MDDFTRVANQLTGLVKSNKYTAMDRATLHVLSIAMREVRVKSGTLRRSHARKVEAGGNRGIVGTKLPYARPLHEGYGPKVIRPKTAKALYWKGARHPVKMVRHPGWRGDPWLRRTAMKGRSGVERELAKFFDGVLARVK